MDRLSDSELLEMAYSNGYGGISEDVYILFKELIKGKR